MVDMSVVRTKIYGEPPLSRREIWRYSGAAQESPDQAELLGECLEAVKGRLCYRVCFTECPLKVVGDAVRVGPMCLHSAALAEHLSGCKGALVLAATVGPELDRLVARYSAVSPAKALMLDAIGTERVEALLDAVIEDLSAELGTLTRRFSPGYGDLALEVQREVFALLDCPKHIGVSLGEGLLMSPMKSVTAIVGVLHEDH